MDTNMSFQPDEERAGRAESPLSELEFERLSREQMVADADQMLKEFQLDYRRMAE